jgi:WD40 repeat protein
VVRCFVGHTNIVNSVAFSSDGRRALSGSADQTVRLWDVADGRELYCYKGHTDTVRGVAFSPDGSWSASGSADRSIHLGRLRG